MNKLLRDFSEDYYGLHVRLAREEDAAFIHTLRTSPKIAPFMHIDGCTIDTQREWLKKYKLREANGEEYYFVYEVNGEPVGLLRLCYFTEHDYHCSSWAFKENIPSYYAFAGALFAREVAFERLGFEEEVNWRDGILAVNKNVIAFMKMMGWKQTGEHYEGDIKMLTGVLKKEDFLKNKSKILRFIPKQ